MCPVQAHVHTHGSRGLSRERQHPHKRDIVNIVIDAVRDIFDEVEGGHWHNTSGTSEYRVGLSLREKSWSFQSVLAVSQQSLSRGGGVEHALTCLLQCHHGGLLNEVALDEVAEILAVHTQVR